MIKLNQNLRLAIFHSEQNPTNKGGAATSGKLLRFALDNKVSANRIINSLNEQISIKSHSKTGLKPAYGKVSIAIPKDWSLQTSVKQANIIFYDKDLYLPEDITEYHKKYPWLIITNARFIAKVDYDWLSGVFSKLNADVVAVNIAPQLQAGYSKTLFTHDNRIVGFRRYYENASEQIPLQNSWPDLLFIKTDVLPALLSSNRLCLSFNSFISKCRSNLLTLRHIRVAGEILDLDSREGLLEHLSNCTDIRNVHGKAYFDSDSNNGDKATIAENVRLAGKVFLGQNTTIARNSVIIGPALIGDNMTIAQDTIVKESIIGTRINIGNRQAINKQIIIDSNIEAIRAPSSKAHLSPTPTTNFNNNSSRAQENRYRTWPKLSYVGFFKRFFDIIVAVLVLVLFAPILLVVALTIKLSSSGPVFFKDKRQSLHGKAFNCLKFRTMMVGADEIQGKLRSESQVDGPQFKMDDDPRVNKTGEFLRDTYLDEIPQFFNVLIGQMSVVGPRPSPETENTLCTYWRDARLSVRPGITGLWQVCRSRKPMKDFQEWIHYDTKYVRDVSFRLDVWICWQTFKQMFMKFVRQF